MEILANLKENLVGPKTAPAATSRTSKGNQVSLVRIHFSSPESDGKLADVGVGGRLGFLICGVIFESLFSGRRTGNTAVRRGFVKNKNSV